MPLTTVVFLVIYVLGLVFVAGSLGTMYTQTIGAIVFGGGLILMAVVMATLTFLHPRK